MNGWVQRGLRTALLTGGLLAVGAGVAAADENDLTAGALGVTATVPVTDAATVQTPVVTGTGGNTAVGDGTGSGTRSGIDLPLDTNTAPGTTALGSDGTGGVSAPVRVVEATDSPPDPADGISVTVPVNTSGGGTAGTTITAPVVTGDVAEVVDGDPATGTEVDIDLDGPLVPGTDGSGVLIDVEDTVTIRGTDGGTAPVTVLQVPAGLEDDRPSTVSLPLGVGDATTEPLSGNDVDVHVGSVIGDGRPPAADEHTEDARPALTVPVGTGDLLSDVAGGGAVSGNTVDVHLDGGRDHGTGMGSVVTVPVNEDGSGTGSRNLVRLTLPINLAGEAPGPGEEPLPGDGSGDGSGTVPGDGSGGSSSGDGSGSGSGVGIGASAGSGDRDGGSTGTVPDCGAGADGPVPGAAEGTEAVYPGGTAAGDAGGPGHGTGTADGGGEACGVGEADAVATQSSSAPQADLAILGLTGLVALGVALLPLRGRTSLRSPSQR